MSEVQAGVVSVELVGRTADLFNEVRDSVRVLNRAAQQITRHGAKIAKALDSVGKAAKQAGRSAGAGGKAAENAIASPLENAATRVERAARRVRAAYASVRVPMAGGRTRTPQAPGASAPQAPQPQGGSGRGGSLGASAQQWQRLGQAVQAVTRAFNAASAALGRAGTAALQAGSHAAQATPQIRKLAGAVGNVGKGAQSLSSASSALRGLNNAAGRAAAGVGSRLASAGEAMQNFGKGAMAALTVPITAFGIATFSVGANFESLRMGLNAVAGSAQEAAVQWERLRIIARAPGIGFEEAIQGSVRLQAVGFSAARAERNLKEFANAIALTGGGKDNLREVTYQLSQMAAKGKVLSEDLKPIIGQSPAVAKALKMAFGTVNPEAIRNLGLSFEEFNDRLLDAMARLPRVAGGARNAWDNFVDSSKQAIDRLAPTILPIAQQVLGLLSGMIERAAGAWQKMSPGMRTIAVSLAVVAAAAGPTIFLIGSLARGMYGLYVVGRTVAGGLALVTAAMRAMAGAQGAVAAVSALRTGMVAIGTFLAGGALVIALAAVATAFVATGIRAQEAAAAARQAAADFREALTGMSDAAVQANAQAANRAFTAIVRTVQKEQEAIADLRNLAAGTKSPTHRDSLLKEAERRTARLRDLATIQADSLRKVQDVSAEMATRQRLGAADTPLNGEGGDKEKGRTPAKVMEDVRESVAEMNREFAAMAARVDAGLMKPTEAADQRAQGLLSTVQKIGELFGELGQMRGLSGDALRNFIAAQSASFDLGGGKTLVALTREAAAASEAAALAEKARTAGEKAADAVDQIREKRMERRNELLREGAELTDKWRSPTEQMAAALKKLNELLSAGAISASIYAKEAAHIREEFGRQAGEIGAILKGTLREAGADAARELARSIIGVFKGERQNLGEKLKAVLERVVEDALTEAISVRLAKALSGGGSLGGLLGGLAGGLGLGSLLGGLGLGGVAPGGSPVAGMDVGTFSRASARMSGAADRMAGALGNLIGGLGALLGGGRQGGPGFGLPNSGAATGIAGILGRLTGILGGIRRNSPMGGILGGLGRLFGGGRFGGMSFGGPRYSFGGFAAEGANTYGGRAYVVGERGRELFVPGARGQIVPMVGGAPAPSSSSAPPAIVFDMSRMRRPANPKEAARDAEWSTLIRETLEASFQQGYRLPRNAIP